MNKYEMEKGKFNLLKTDPQQLEENPKRPVMWGKLCIPDNAKAGDILKLSVWKETSNAGNAYLSGKCQLEEKPSSEETPVGTEVSEDDLPF